MAAEAILGYLATSEEIPDSGQFASQHGFQHNDVVNVIKSLHGFRYIEAQDIKRESWVLTDEGKKYAADGSPEFQLFLAVPQEGSISKDELQKKLEPSVFKIGCSQAGKNKWVDMGKQVSRKVQHVEDKVKDLLIRIQKGEALGKDDINSLKARKLIVAQTWKGYSVKKGPNYAPTRKKVATDLTRENLQRGDWKELEFKEYNFNAKGPPAEAGHLHPLLKKLEAEKLRREKRKIEEDRDSLKTEYKKICLTMKNTGLEKSSEQWQQELQEEKAKANYWKRKFQEMQARNKALEKSLAESRNENGELKARVAELEQSLHHYRSRNFEIELKSSLNKIEKMRYKIEELELALHSWELWIALLETREGRW